MKLSNRGRSARRAAGLLLAGTGLLLAGCGRDDVKVYQVVRSDSPAPAPASSPAPSPAAGLAAPAADAGAMPTLNFALPPGWQQVAAGQMRVASFSVTNTAGPAGDVGIIPLPAGENELAMVNMWRDQLQLPATNAAASEPVVVGSDPAKLYEFVSEAPVLDGKYRQRNLVAMQTRGTLSWFFKLTGEDSFVAEQKPVFLDFLKTVTFSAAAPAAAMAASATAAPPAGSIWTIPADWQALPPSQFLLAQYKLQAGGGQAEVNVSQLAGDGGGLQANANRWRRQLGLDPVTQEEDFSKMVEAISVPGGQAELVDFSGTSSQTGQVARLVGVVLPLNGSTWFYKLMGDPAAVAAAKTTFLNFIQSAHYPDAR